MHRITGVEKLAIFIVEMNIAIAKREAAPRWRRLVRFLEFHRLKKGPWTLCCIRSARLRASLAAACRPAPRRHRTASRP